MTPAQLIGLSPTRHLNCCLQVYEERRLTDPDFYRDANSLAYGKDPGDPAAAIDRMVGELNDQCALNTLHPKPLPHAIALRGLREIMNAQQR